MLNDFTWNEWLTIFPKRMTGTVGERNSPLSFQKSKAENSWFPKVKVMYQLLSRSRFVNIVLLQLCLNCETNKQCLNLSNCSVPTAFPQNPLPLNATGAIDPILYLWYPTTVTVNSQPPNSHVKTSFCVKVTLAGCCGAKTVPPHGFCSPKEQHPRTVTVT